MEVVKRTVVEVKTTDGKIINEGETVILVANGYTIVGVYRGISKKSALMFEGVAGFSDVTFNILPKSIKCIFKVHLSTEKAGGANE